MRWRWGRGPVLPARGAAPTGWLIRFSSHRGISVGLVAAIAITDRLVRQQQLAFVPRALMDEPCHLATAIVILGTIARSRRRPPSPWFVWAMLSASVLIDVDHLPQALGTPVLTAGTPRPYTHALWVLAAASCAAAVLAARQARDSTAAGQAPGSTAAGQARDRRAARAAQMTGIAAGAAWGLAAHFLRDVATAQIALWWPVSSAGVHVPHYWYLLALLVLALWPPPRYRPAARRGAISSD
jgi:hypothetical protein